MTVILFIIKFFQQNWQQNNLKQKISPLHKALDMTLNTHSCINFVAYNTGPNIYVSGIAWVVLK